MMETKKVKVLELFSGIGGMHYSLCRAKKILNEIYEEKSKNNETPKSKNNETPKRFDFEVVSAVDISEVANKVYRHNFPGVNHGSGNICGLKPEVLEKKGIEAIFMSPPCQPFTRQGLKKDLQDNRSQPLVHLAIKVIPKLKKLNYILVENVKGFETSESRDLLTATLTEIGFTFQEFLINPNQIGIPNSRLRYYLIGKRKPETFEFETRDEIYTSLNFKFCDELSAKFELQTKRSLSDYLSILTTPETEMFKIPDKVLEKYAMILDILRQDSTNSCCFTKAYTKYAEGTGSVIQQKGDLDDLRRVYERAQKFSAKKDPNSAASDPNSSASDPKVIRLDETVVGQNSEENRMKLVSTLKELELRYFTPIEIAKLLGFPAGQCSGESQIKFEFPPDFSGNSTQAYRVLGNSLSVTTVSLLTSLLFLKF